MYVSSIIHREICVPPSKLDWETPHECHVVEALQELEGECVNSSQYIAKLENIISINNAVVQRGSGDVVSDTKIEASMFMPVPQEIVEATVTSATNMGFFARAGRLNIYVPPHYVSGFEASDDAFFCRATGEVIKERSNVFVQIMKFNMQKENDLMAVGRHIYPHM